MKPIKKRAVKNDEPIFHIIHELPDVENSTRNTLYFIPTFSDTFFDSKKGLEKKKEDVVTLTDTMFMLDKEVDMELESAKITVRNGSFSDFQSHLLQHILENREHYKKDSTICVFEAEQLLCDMDMVTAKPDFVTESTHAWLLSQLKVFMQKSFKITYKNCHTSEGHDSVHLRAIFALLDGFDEKTQKEFIQVSFSSNIWRFYELVEPF